MKILWKLLFRKSGKTGKPQKNKKKKKNLSLVLLDKLGIVLLAALALKWNEDLWKPE